MRFLQRLHPTFLLIVGWILIVGVGASAPHTAFAQDTEAVAESTQVATPPCSEPTPCPAPDSTQNPEVTCYEPRSASASEPFTLHIYGRYLTKAEDPPRQLIYRNNQDSGAGGYTNDEVEVQSACHVTTTLNVVPNIGLRRGTTMEFRLLRTPPTMEERRQGATGIVSDWFEVELTE